MDWIELRVSHMWWLLGGPGLFTTRTRSAPLRIYGGPCSFIHYSCRASHPPLRISHHSYASQVKRPNRFLLPCAIYGLTNPNPNAINQQDHSGRKDGVRASEGQPLLRYVGDLQPPRCSEIRQQTSGLLSPRKDQLSRTFLPNQTCGLLVYIPVNDQR